MTDFVTFLKDGTRVFKAGPEMTDDDRRRLAEMRIKLIYAPGHKHHCVRTLSWSATSKLTDKEADDA